MNDVQILDQLEHLSNEFMALLKSGDGFNEGTYEKLCEAMRQCCNLWKGRDSIPKRAVAVFIEFDPWLASCENLYPEPTSERIQDARMILTELAFACTESNLS